jgi:hypothetical protein
MVLAEASLSVTQRTMKNAIDDAGKIINGIRLIQ